MFLRILPKLTSLIALLCISHATFAAWELNMKPGVTETSKSIYDLHMAIIWICVGIGVVVFGIMFYSLFAHRKSKGAKPADFHESTKVELIWTIIPFVILIAMAIPATKTLIKMYDTSDADINIMVTGYMWKWHYKYQDQGVEFFSNLRTPIEEINNEAPKGEHYLLDVDEPLVVPINKKIRFVFTANDVIHSWWIPAFGLKKDAIPGVSNEDWTKITEPGYYRGQCTELCGKNHGFMPIVVKATTQEEYEAWLEQKQIETREIAETIGKEWTLEELMAKGEEAYVKNCAACHGQNGEGVATFPALKGSEMATTAEGREKHIKIVLEGVDGTLMQAFGKQLNAVDIAAIITYERNAWGNDTNDITQPSEIHELIQNMQ